METHGVDHSELPTASPIYTVGFPEKKDAFADELPVFSNVDQ